MPASKKSRKDVKESGGVVAAVTKHATKLSNADGSKVFPPSPSPPTARSPEIKPVTPPFNGHPGPSPSLDALSTTSFAPSTAPSTNEWTRAMAGISGSPGNLISLMGESPPTQPSSYEDPRGLPYGWSSPRPYVNSHPASASPPTSTRRPLSFHMDAHYHSPPDFAGHANMNAIRRSSLHSQAAHNRASPHPPLPHQPLPHQPQAHFYGAPDIDFGLQPQAGMKAGERGYHFAFDTLPTAGSEHTPGANNAVLAGYEGGLEVYSVAKRGIEHAASLSGLRGSVLHAKVLPWTAGDDVDLYPLVAAVVHGPVLPQDVPEVVLESDDEAGGEHDDLPAHVDPGQKETRSVLAIEFYQTSVEVYSLKTKKLVDVLIQAPKVPLATPITSPVFIAPPPTGAFQIRAERGTLAVISGTTGECWIFRQVSGENSGSRFACFGKLWTSLQQPVKADVPQEEDRLRSPTPPRRSTQNPIVALRGRWIAYCPSAPSSQIALRASVLVPVHGRAPGLASVTPPQPPTVTSEVDLPFSDGVMNKIMRETTQELIQGAKWVGQQGLQAWNSYWNKPAVPSTRSPPPVSAWGYPARKEVPQFPPTHGSAMPAVSKDPGVVSVVDLETLGMSTVLHPVTTFATPLGCSFLSFTPSGLSLFTASTKGDVQTVWDLMRVQHTKPSPLQTSAMASSTTGPRIRQIAQFSRMTVARIVDVAWAKPNGERAAMVTERGTVHLLEMPPSAFIWPPPRIRPPKPDAGAGPPEPPGSAVSIASSAINTAFDAARLSIVRPRRSSANVPQAAGASIMDHASQGGKVIAAGISHSLGKTGNAINHFRQAGENRVSMPAGTSAPGLSCVVWVSGKKSHTLFALGTGLVRMFPSKDRRPASGNERLRTSRGSRYRDFNLPGLPDDPIAAAVKQFTDPDEYLDFMEREDAGNTTVLNVKARPQMNIAADSSIPQAEIESSAPYQPFHTDRRIGLYEYADQAEHATLPPPSMSTLLEATRIEDRPAPRRKKQAQIAAAKAGPKAWAFGQEISAVRLDLGHPAYFEDDFNQADDSRALPASAIERVLQRGDDDEQIVVTTRRRRGAGRPEDPDDDGFFEDDCEVLDFADQRV